MFELTEKQIKYLQNKKNQSSSAYGAFTGMIVNNVLSQHSRDTTEVIKEIFDILMGLDETLINYEREEEAKKLKAEVKMEF